MTSLDTSTLGLADDVGRLSSVSLDPTDAAYELPGPARSGHLLIDRRLNGPRRFANGGFAAGAMARYIDADTVTVVLRRPVALGRRLDVVGEGAGCRVLRRRTLVAEAHPGRLAGAPEPPAPDYGAALLARDAHPFADVRHALSDCVVCGPRRVDGMHVTPGPVPDRPDLLAAPWVVSARDSVGGAAPLEAIWGAIDCTSYPAAALRSRTLCLLGTITAAVERRPRIGEELVVYSWTREQRGRRYETSAVLIDRSQSVVARADATWIAVRRRRLQRIGTR